MALVEKKDEPEPKRTRVAILLFDGAEIIDYAGPWEAFGEAGFEVFTVAEKKQPISATFGQKVLPDYTFADSPAADILLVPGGGVRNAVQDAALIEWVKKTTQATPHVMSVCTGAFILARAGLLDGLGATTVSHALDDLAKAAPKARVVHDQRFVDNGKIVTTAGLSSGIDGAFHLIATIKGLGTAQATALGMEYRWDPDSKFARAALADRYFPEIDDVDAEILSTKGDTDHWEARALLSKPSSSTAILDLLGKRLSATTPHAQGSVVVEKMSGATADAPELRWKFTDDEGRKWTGRAVVERSADQPQKFVLLLNLEADTKAKRS